MVVSHRFVVLVALFVACLITANVVAVKLVSLGSHVVPAAIFVFPLSYIFGDVLTEVYGYGWARRVIWLGFLCNLLFVFFAWIGQILPPAPFWQDQRAYESILGYAPRLLTASLSGYLVGEFVNSYVLSRIRSLTRGRWLWMRTIASTVLGQGLDTGLFVTVAFLGTPAFAPIIILNHWVAKVGIEIVATPLTYAVVGWLKRREPIDSQDHATTFNPFAIRAV